VTGARSDGDSKRQEAPPASDAPVEELVEEAENENPDSTTRRETLELELMERDRSEEGAELEIVPPEVPEPDAIEQAQPADPGSEADTPGTVPDDERPVVLEEEDAYRR
jgi:hypothetical protein